MVLAEQRQVFDLPQPRLDVTIYRMFKVCCPKLKHAICGAHILRELQGLADNEYIKWAKVFKAFYFMFTHYPLKKG